MNRLSISTAIACLLLIFLFFLIHGFDSELAPWSQIGIGESPSSSSPQGAPESVTAPQTLTCEETENALRNRVDSARSCTTDSDCTLFDFGYPIDCMTSVAKSEITSLRHEYRGYEQSCNFRVYFDCPAQPMVRRAVCKQNRCAVSLETTDGLESETLDYLGIGSSGQEK